MVEAATGDAPVLPSVSADRDFLCGHEFATLDAEVTFFADRSLDLPRTQIEIALQPGELLFFDNFRIAHGRRGVRRPGELRQMVFGHRALDREGQANVRESVLRAFTAG